ncbi:unnamed protein product [Amoebophrya sp. A25]|nr:unnamed protein product [Amoebophrya sp. A25]|eukprot:GSA25T00018616001.1
METSSTSEKNPGAQAGVEGKLPPIGTSYDMENMVEKIVRGTSGTTSTENDVNIRTLSRGLISLPGGKGSPPRPQELRGREVPFLDNNESDVMSETLDDTLEWTARTPIDLFDETGEWQWPAYMPRSLPKARGPAGEILKSKSPPGVGAVGGSAFKGSASGGPTGGAPIGGPGGRGTSSGGGAGSSSGQGQNGQSQNGQNRPYIHHGTSGRSNAASGVTASGMVYGGAGKFYNNYGAFHNNYGADANASQQPYNHAPGVADAYPYSYNGRLGGAAVGPTPSYNQHGTRIIDVEYRSRIPYHSVDHGAYYDSSAVSGENYINYAAEQSYNYTDGMQHQTYHDYNAAYYPGVAGATTGIGGAQYFYDAQSAWWEWDAESHREGPLAPCEQLPPQLPATSSNTPVISPSVTNATPILNPMTEASFTASPPLLVMTQTALSLDKLVPDHRKKQFSVAGRVQHDVVFGGNNYAKRTSTSSTTRTTGPHNSTVLLGPQNELEIGPHNLGLDLEAQLVFGGKKTRKRRRRKRARRRKSSTIAEDDPGSGDSCEDEDGAEDAHDGNQEDNIDHKDGRRNTSKNTSSGIRRPQAEDAGALTRPVPSTQADQIPNQGFEQSAQDPHGQQNQQGLGPPKNLDRPAPSIAPPRVESFSSPEDASDEEFRSPREIPTGDMEALSQEL